MDQTHPHAKSKQRAYAPHQNPNLNHQLTRRNSHPTRKSHPIGKGHPIGNARSTSRAKKLAPIGATSSLKSNAG